MKKILIHILFLSTFMASCQKTKSYYDTFELKVNQRQMGGYIVNVLNNTANTVVYAQGTYSAASGMLFSYLLSWNLALWE